MLVDSSKIHWKMSALYYTDTHVGRKFFFFKNFFLAVSMWYASNITWLVMRLWLSSSLKCGSWLHLTVRLQKCLRRPAKCVQEMWTVSPSVCVSELACQLKLRGGWRLESRIFLPNVVHILLYNISSLFIYFKWFSTWLTKNNPKNTSICVHS